MRNQYTSTFAKEHHSREQIIRRKAARDAAPMHVYRSPGEQGYLSGTPTFPS